MTTLAWARQFLLALALSTAALAQSATYTSLVAGTSPGVAPGAAASMFGDKLASTTAIASAPYPTTLGGITLQVTDSAGVTRGAPLLYVSPSQVNYIVPLATAIGPATVRVDQSITLSAAVHVDAVLPALFTADGDGQGVVAATAIRTVLPTNISSPVPVFQCDAPGKCHSVPIDPGVDAPVSVTLYATGIHNRSRDSNVTLNIGGVLVPISSIQSFDETSVLAGIDLVTFPVLLTLRGKGEVDVFLVVDGFASNMARINIL